jgi:hypothetical protein
LAFLDIVTYRKVMQDLTSRRAASSRSRLRFRASTRSLAFKVSHQRPGEWSPPAKEADGDDHEPRGKKGKRGR